MRTLFIIFCLLTAFYQSNSQVYFSKTYDIDEWYEFALSVIEIPSEEYVLVGSHVTTTFRAMQLLKVDEYGDLGWNKIYGVEPIGYFPKKMIRLADGSLIVTGSVADSAGADFDGLLAKFNSQGDSIWFKEFGGTNSDVLKDFEQTEDGGFILAGYTHSFGGVDRDIWVVKTDSLGNLLWYKTFGGSSSDQAFDIAYTPEDSGFIISGNGATFGSGIYVLKLDKTGSKMWDLTLDVNIPAQGGGILVTRNGNYLVRGAKDLLNGDGKYGYLAKIHSSGDSILWEYTYGGPGVDLIIKVIELDDGSLIAVGVIVNALDDDPGWIMKLNSQGDSLWSRRHLVPSSAANYFYDVKQTQDKGFIACGFADGPTQDVWLVKLDSLGCLVEGCAVGFEDATQTQFQVSVMPNPFHGRTLVQIPQQRDGITFEVYDVFGRNVRNSAVTSTFTFYQEDLPAGLYLYRLRDGAKVLATGRVVID